MNEIDYKMNRSYLISQPEEVECDLNVNVRSGAFAGGTSNQSCIKSLSKLCQENFPGRKKIESTG